MNRLILPCPAQAPLRLSTQVMTDNDDGTPCDARFGDELEGESHVCR